MKYLNSGLLRTLILWYLWSGNGKKYLLGAFILEDLGEQSHSVKIE